MRYEIEIFRKNPEIFLQDLEFIFPGVNISIEFSKLYLIQGELTNNEIKRSIQLLFCDPVVEKYRINYIKANKELSMKKETKDKISDIWEVKIYYHSDVTDPGSSTIMKALRDINIPVEDVVTGKRYLLKGKRLRYNDVELITKRVLANYIVEDAIITKINGNPQQSS